MPDSLITDALAASTRAVPSSTGASGAAMCLSPSTASTGVA